MIRSETIALDAIRARLPGAAITGALRLQDGAALPGGALEAKIADLAPLGRVLGAQLGGAGTLALELGGGSAPVLRTTALALNDLTIGDIEIAALGGRGTISLSDAGPRSDAALELSGLSAGPLRGASGRVTASGSPDALGLSAEVEGTLDGDPATLSAAAALNLGAETGRVTALRFTRGGATAALDRPGDLTLGSAPSLRGLTMGLSSPGGRTGTLVLERFSFAPFAVALAAQGTPAAALSALGGGGALDGVLDGRAELDAAQRSGRIALTLAPADDGSDEAALLGRIALDGGWDGARLALSLRGRDGALGGLTGSLTLPLQAEGSGIRLPGSGAMAGRLDWAGPIGPVWRVADVPGHSLSGEAAVSLTLRGTPDAPAFGGTARLTGGTYENEDAGTALKRLSLTAQADGTDRFRLSLSGRAGSGRVEGAGSADFGGEAPRIAAQITLDGAQLLDRDDARARVSGTLSLDDDPQTEDAGLLLSGRLTAQEVEARFPERLPPDFVTIEVTEVNRPGGPRETQTADEGAGLPIRLDVTVDVPGPARLSGRGLDSLWAGTIAVAGTALDPRLAGELSAQRGGFTLAGKRFDLRDSAVRFRPGPAIDPDLDIAAVASGGGIDATVRLTGPVSRPEFAIESSPAVPQDEALARVLFGKSVSALSPFEAAQMAASLAETAGVGGVTGGLLDLVRGALGVDVLRVETQDGASAPSVTVGKYLAPGIYVGVSRGAEPGSTKARVEIEVTDDISVETDIGEDAGAGAGVLWSRDY